jgi:hypothetical protein
MENKIVQLFLDRSLLDLGEEPDRLALVKGAADDLAGTLKTNRRSLLRSRGLHIVTTLCGRQAKRLPMPAPH